MITVEYDEMEDGWYFVCHDHEPPVAGRTFFARYDAEMDADRHDELHDDGVI